jgi:hypothetical protein
VTVRAYLPSSLRSLDELVATTDQVEGEPGGSGYAVTEAARAAHPGADEEELEYLAMTSAALESPHLLADGEPQRRLVLAVDVDSVQPSGDEDDVFAVRIGGFRLPSDVAAYHLDDADAEPDVRRARAAWRSQAAGWEDLVARTADHELGWYAPTELPQLLDIYADGCRPGPTPRT